MVQVRAHEDVVEGAKMWLEEQQVDQNGDGARDECCIILFDAGLFGIGTMSPGSR